MIRLLNHKQLQVNLALGITIVLLVAACGSSSDDGYEVADRVLQRLGQPSGEQLPVPNGCETIESVDEYGFVSEITTCKQDAPVETIPAEDLEEAATADPGQLLNAAGDLPSWVLPALVVESDSALTPSLLSMLNSLQTLDAACGSDFFAWRSSLAELSRQSQDLIELIGSGKGADYVGTTEARALSRALMERSLLETGCQSPGGGEPFTEADLIENGTLELTSQAALRLSELGRDLDDASSGYLFHFFTTADNYEWLRTQTENVDLIVYGTSQAGAAIDVPALAQAMSTNAGNAFLYGSLAEVQQHWFPEVERYVDADTVVWLVGAIDLLIDCEPIGREKQFTDRVIRRQRTFAASGWFDAIDPIDLLLGPAGPPNRNKGNGLKQAEPDPVALENHVEEYTERFAAAQFCESRALTIKNAVDRMAADERRVVIVGMPLSPIAYQQLAGGAASMAEAVSRLSAELGDGPADVIDLSSVLQDRVEVWADYTHLTQAGATEFTDLLVAELKKLGL